jgi:8-oxo-dGTP diphosphatase
VDLLNALCSGVLKMTRVRRSRPELRVAAYAVCVEDGNLLVARFIGHGQRQWTLPGGGIDHGEDPYDAVIREVAEETGYTVHVEHLLGIHSARRRYQRGWGAFADHHAVRVFYTVRITGGDLRHEVGGSTDTAAWIPLDKLDQQASERSDLVDVGLALARGRPPTGHTGQ